MKKLLAVLLAGVALVACSNNEGSKSENAASAAQSSVTASEPSTAPAAASEPSTAPAAASEPAASASK